MSTEPATPTWHKSTYSGTQENCVEVAHTGHAVLLRDSKNPAGEPVTMSPDGFDALLSELGDTTA